MAVAYDTTSNSGALATTDTATWSHTCTGSNLALFVGGGSRAGTPASTTSVTYNGVSMTELFDDIFAGIFTHISCHGLAAPASGANNVVVTLSASNDEVYYGAISATDVNQAVPFGTIASNASDADNTPTTTVGSVGADDLVVDAVVGAHDGAATAGADQTERWDLVGGTCGSTQPGSSGGVMSWTIGGVGWYQAAIAFKPAVSGSNPAPIIDYYYRLIGAKN